MRFSPAAIAMTLVLATVSSQGIGKTEKVAQINPLSIAWVDRGIEAQNIGDLTGASNAYETALAIDPRNRVAYIALGQVARAEGLTGKAIRFYREALILDPNDTRALAGQGEAMAQKGALAKARENLAKVEQLCKSECSDAKDLAAAITRHGTTASLGKEMKANPTLAAAERP